MTELTESLHEEAPIVSEKLKGSLGTYQIALLVIAAAAPLGAVLTAAPIGFQLGNGPGLAGTFLLAGFLMVCFSVGYSGINSRDPECRRVLQVSFSGVWSAS